MGALSWEGLLGAVVFVLLVAVGALGLVTGVFGGVAYVFVSGIANLFKSPPPDLASFLLLVASVVTVGFFAANSR